MAETSHEHVKSEHFNNNVVSINKNANLASKQDSNYNGLSIFMFDTFVELLVMQVYSRMSVDKMLCKEDIKQIKKHMLKNEVLYNGFSKARYFS